jgi:hypothetical protein
VAAEAKIRPQEAYTQEIAPGCGVAILEAISAATDSKQLARAGQSFGNELILRPPTL